MITTFPFFQEILVQKIMAQLALPTDHFNLPTSVQSHDHTFVESSLEIFRIFPITTSQYQGGRSRVIEQGFQDLEMKKFVNALFFFHLNLYWRTLLEARW